MGGGLFGVALLAPIVQDLCVAWSCLVSGHACGSGDPRLRHAEIGEPAVHNDVVEHDPERPHVRLHCEVVVEGGLGRAST